MKNYISWAATIDMKGCDFGTLLFIYFALMQYIETFMIMGEDWTICIAR